MRNRMISMLLCAVLLLGMVFIAPGEAAAASNMQCSEDAIAVLKQFEGYSKYPYGDNGLYYVGYGCYCPDEDVARYQQNGITEEEADALLREYLNDMIPSLNNFANKNGLTFTQNEFDALMLFTYNVGTSWMSQESEFRTAVLNGVKGNDFIYYITRWCTANSQILTGLVNRRLAEADMFLNGNYSKEVPSYYSYVLFDANGGSCESRIQGYDAAETAKTKVEATLAGSQFLGWYTAKEGGRRITDLDTTTAKLTLYAHWQGEGSEGVAAEYERTVTKDQNVFSLDGKGTVVGTLKAGETVTIVMDYLDANGILWGKTASGWIDLSGTEQKLVPAEKTEKTSVTVTVTNDFLNVRSGPGITYDLVGGLSYGDQLVITDVVTVGEEKWGQFSGGWVCLKYTNYDAVISGDSGTDADEVVVATGTVINCSSLRIRSGPGTAYAHVGNLAVGTTVEILQITTVGTTQWGRIAQGWISLDYVQLDEKASEPEEAPPATEPEEAPPATEPEEAPPATEPEETPPATEPETDTDTAPKTQTGTVINCQQLNVRSGPGTHNAKVGTIARGTKVEILETTVVNNSTWGRVEQGWVSMHYIQLDYVSSDNGDGVRGTVYNCSKLNVRKAPGTNNAAVGYLMPGDQVMIYEETAVNGMPWGRTDLGWVCMTYIRLDETGSSDTENDSATGDSENTETETAGTRTGVVVGTNALRVRSGPGTHNAQVGTLTGGTTVVVYETTLVNGVSWGRIDKGWICLNYVQLDAQDGSFTGTVNTNGLKIRSAAGTTNAILGTYNKGTKVTILETTSVNGVAWGRTDKGWICLQYVTR